MSASDMAFWTLFLSTPVTVFFLARCGGIRLDRFTIPNVLLLSYGIFAYAGIPLLYYQFDPLRLSLGITDKGLLFTLLVQASLAWVGLALGFWLFRRLLGPVAQAMPAVREEIRTRVLLFAGLLFAASLAAYALYLSHTPGPALLAAFHHDYDAQIHLRSQMSMILSAASLAWCPLFYEDILSFLCFFLFSLALTRKRPAIWLFWTAVFSSLAVISLLAAQKAPLLHLLAGLFLAFVLTRDGGRLTRRNLAALLAIVAVGMVVLALILLTGNDNLGVNLASMASRMLTGSLAPAYFYLKFFPGAHSFLHGASCSNLLGLLPFETFNLTREIHAFMAPDVVARGIVGSAPTAFWGEAYANFGPAGPPVVAVGVGLYVCFLQAVVGRLQTNAVTVGLLSWLILHVQFLSITSFSNYLADQHLAAVSAAALGCYFLQDRRCLGGVFRAVAETLKGRPHPPAEANRPVGDAGPGRSKTSAS